MVNLFLCFVGTVFGTALALLPGLSPLTVAAVLLPLTFQLDPTGALFMLAGIYCGSSCAGSITAILDNAPSAASPQGPRAESRQLMLQRRVGPALLFATVGSLFAGTIATLAVGLISPPLAQLGSRFTRVEAAAMILLTLLTAARFSGAPVKAILMVFAGALLGLVGLDTFTATERMTFGNVELFDGIGIVPLAVGLFGIADIIHSLATREDRPLGRVGTLIPTPSDVSLAVPAVLRGTGVGLLLGFLPSAARAFPRLAAYTFEKRVSTNPARFGTGAIEGIAAPESANHAAAQAGFAQLFALGVPTNAYLALMIAVLSVHGFQFGPLFIAQHGQAVWTAAASLWMANALLLFVLFPFIGVWIALLRARDSCRPLLPAVVALACVLVYTVNNSIFDIWVTLIFGVLGYLFIKVRAPRAALLFGFVLGPQFDGHFREVMQSSGGDILVFLTRPISAALLLLAVFVLIVPFLPAIRARRAATQA